MKSKRMLVLGMMTCLMVAGASIGLAQKSPSEVKPSGSALSRMLGDGWQPLGMAPEALGQGIATLREEARAAGRDAAKIPVSIAMSLAAARLRRMPTAL